MKKQELATVLRDRLELGSLKDANRVIDEFAKILSEAMVAGDEVTLPDVGTFKTVMSAARKCRNPKTGDVIEVPEKKVVRFRVAGKLKKSMNE